MPPENDMPDLFVVDGSNIATEGRDKPSLEHLNDALDAFREEYPKLNLTVVVDATFGHRIARKEKQAFDRAIANNEIVTPPAGAVGRGDAFILAIADKAGAGVLSNDSFQEFHGEYGWLFEHGRLIGGKPVPHVGWVFVDRNPVRGPKSRQAVKAANSKRSSSKRSRPADEPSDESSGAASPTDTKVAANRRVRKKRGASHPSAPATPSEPASRDAASDADVDADAAGDAGSTSDKPSTHVNELMPFLDFVERQPVGAQVAGKVDSYSSHGAYARVGDVLVYIPLRLMSDPPPTSARKVLKIGDDVDLVITGFVPDRRSIDAALPGMAPAEASDARSAAGKRAKKSAAKKTVAKRTAAKKTAAKKSAAKKTAAKKTAAKTSAATQPSRKRRAAKPAARKSGAKKSTAKKSTARQSAARAPAKKPAARKSAAKRSTAKRSTARKSAAGEPASRRPSTRRRTSAGNDS